MTTPLFNIMERNLAVPDEDRIQTLTARKRSTRAQVAGALTQVCVVLKSGRCMTVKDACLMVSLDTGVSLHTLKVKYSKRATRV